MKLLRGEYTDAKATSKTIPSFWGFVNIVYGVPTAGKSSLSAFSFEDSRVRKPDSRVSFSDMSHVALTDGASGSVGLALDVASRLVYLRDGDDLFPCLPNHTPPDAG